jgi:hypothetical protein
VTTRNELVEEIIGNLSGYSLRQDKTTHLTASLSASALSATIASVENISKGLMEVDDELIWVDSTDRISNTVSIAPYGRGYRSTTPENHDSLAKITIAPSYPRYQVIQAINQTILSTFPRLFATASTTFTYNASKTSYNLPSDFEDALAVSWSTVGPTQEWLPVRRYRVDRMAATGSFTGGKSISLYDFITPGRTVQVFYSKKPSQMTSASSVFTTTTGLPESCVDVIMYGAAYRLISFIDPARLSFTSPEANENDPNRPLGSGTNASRFILALYQQRLTEEEQKLKAEYPVRVYFTT